MPKKSSPIDRFSTMTGSYTGTSALWLDPSKPPEKASAKAKVTTFLDGKFLRIEYQTRSMGKPNKGILQLGHNPENGEYHGTFVDSFHMSPAMMFFNADRKATPKEVSLLGDYSAGPDQPRWFWRTVIAQPDANTLRIRMFNVPPSDEGEMLAVEMKLAKGAKARKKK